MYPEVYSEVERAELVNLEGRHPQVLHCWNREPPSEIMLPSVVNAVEVQWMAKVSMALHEVHTDPTMSAPTEEADELPDVSEKTATTAPTTQVSPNSIEKRKRKRKPKNHVLLQSTFRSPSWSYIHLQHLASSGTALAMDALTAHLHLTAALSQFLGLHGAAIPIDILKLEGADVWIRVPAADSSALIAAVGGWVSSKGEGWRVKGSSSWDARAMGRDGGQDLFND